MDEDISYIIELRHAGYWIWFDDKEHNSIIDCEEIIKYAEYDRGGALYRIIEVSRKEVKQIFKPL